jgi:hypothetical protein
MILKQEISRVVGRSVLRLQREGCPLETARFVDDALLRLREISSKFRMLAAIRSGGRRDGDKDNREAWRWRGDW